MAFVEPQIADFKAYFVRDFPYGTDQTTVMDADITSALMDADSQINQDLWSTQAEFNVAFLNLAAHFLVMNLRASSQGLNGTFGWLESSKGVGSVSESFAIPDRIAQDARLSMYAKTNYGAKYLMLLLPYLVGGMFSVQGGTQP